MEAGSPYYLVLYIIDVLIIIICCLIIWTKLFRAEKSLMRVGNSFPQYIQDQQKDKTKTLSILLLCAVICNLNVLAIAISVNNLSLFYAINSIYYLQYGLNVLIFVGSNPQYRTMYLQTFNDIIPKSMMNYEFKLHHRKKEVNGEIKKEDCVLEYIKRY